MKIFVLIGGCSSEKNISIKTGNAIIASLSKYHDRIKPINIVSDQDFSFLDEIQEGDIVFNALHGGIGENGDIQSILEINNISFTGSGSKASKVCMNKHLTKLVAQSEGVPVPRWVLYRDNRLSKNKIFNSQKEQFPYPYIIKPNDEGSTMGLTKVDCEDQIDEAVITALEFSSEIMIEEYVSGREITVGILGNKPLPIVEIFPEKDFFDYECKYSKGMSSYQVPAEIDKDLALKIQKDALRIHEAVGCRHYSRVDFILDENNINYFLELNSLPGMTSTSLFPMAAKHEGVSFDKLINIILNMALLNYD